MKRLGSLAFIAIAGLAVTPEAGAPQTRASADRIGLGVVAVEAKVGGDAVRGSGTVIDADRGLVLTSAQAVWGATSLKLSTGLGIVYGRIVARAACDGLALLETQPRIPGLVALDDAPGAPPATGALVTAYGRRLTRGEGGMLALPTRVAGPPLQLDARLVPDAAGGPLLDADERVVGMASADGAAIPWTTVQDRLAELTPGPRRVFAGWRDQYECAARLNRRTRAAHPGFKARDARLVIPVPATRIPGAGDAG